MNIVAPISAPGAGRKYVEALPQFSKEESDKGHVMAVGFALDNCIVYRCSWDQKLNRTNWNFLYMVPWC